MSGGIERLELKAFADCRESAVRNARRVLPVVEDVENYIIPFIVECSWLLFLFVVICELVFHSLEFRKGVVCQGTVHLGVLLDRNMECVVVMNMVFLFHSKMKLTQKSRGREIFVE